jgi:uncharacterized membrane protein YidH (DUF202 family)
MQSILRTAGSFYVHAATYTTVVPPSIKDIITDIVTLVNSVLFTVAPILLVIMLAYAGILRMSSSTDADRLKTANATITWAITGYVITIAAYLIVLLVVTALGYDTKDFGTIQLPS